MTTEETGQLQQGRLSERGHMSYSRFSHSSGVSCHKEKQMNKPTTKHQKLTTRKQTKHTKQLNQTNKMEAQTKPQTILKKPQLHKQTRKSRVSLVIFLLREWFCSASHSKQYEEKPETGGEHSAHLFLNLSWAR